MFVTRGIDFAARSAHIPGTRCVLFLRLACHPHRRWSKNGKNGLNHDNMTIYDMINKYYIYTHINDMPSNMAEHQQLYA